jgi:S1-C subfamily serine protease
MNKKLYLVAALLLLPLMMLAGFGLPALRAASAAPAAAQAAPPAASSDLAAGDVLNALETRLGEIYDKVNPSVVNIQVVLGTASQLSNQSEIPNLPDNHPAPQALASGFVWDKSGYIVTNNHVVDGAEKVTVTFSDNTTAQAEVVGTDPDSDLAVIKVDVPSEQLYPVQLADSTQVRTGQLAVAIGNPFGLEGTMTVGFVSALGRSLPVNGSDLMAPSYTIPDIIQTDAPINPGNSGGVLADDEGQVIGVPTAIESPVEANAGIGFAVPSAIVEKVVPALIRDGRYEHPWLGISGRSLDSELAQAMDLGSDQRGVLVVEVTADSPAAKAGLQGSDKQVELSSGQAQVGGDVIVAINGEPVKEFDDLVTYLARSTSVGDVVKLTLLRGGREETVQVTLAARPKEQESASTTAQGQGQGQQQAPAAGAWLGIRGLTLTSEIAQAMDLPADQQGVLIAEVVGGSPADQAGLRSGDQQLDVNGQQVQVGGDVIVAIDGKSIAQFEDLRAWLQQAEPGQVVTLTLIRGGEEIPVKVTLGERPATTP